MFSAPLIYAEYFFIAQRDVICLSRAGSGNAAARKRSRAEMNERAREIICAWRSFNGERKATKQRGTRAGMALFNSARARSVYRRRRATGKEQRNINGLRYFLRR